MNPEMGLLRKKAEHEPSGLRCNELATGPSMDVLIVLFLLCVAIRLPFWFNSVINWDESTFILMGQEILDGHLPYVRLWELKPPLAFLPFALFITLHPSIVAVRVGGAVCVFISACLAYVLANRLGGKATGSIAGILVIVFVSVAEAGQATLTETIAIVPLLAVTVILTSRSERFGHWLTVGILVATASLIRLNLAYVAIAAALLPALRLVGRGNAGRARPMAGFVVGALLPTAVVVLPYVVSGRIQTLWSSAVRTPLLYATSRGSPWRALTNHLTNGFHKADFLLWGGFVIGLLMLWSRWPRLSANTKRTIGILGLLTGATGISLVLGGATPRNDLIQIIPFLAVVAAVPWGTGLTARGTGRLLTSFVVFVGLVLPLAPVAKQYLRSFYKLKNNGTLFSDRGYDIAEYLERHNPEACPVYLMSDQIVYWLTDSKPLSRLSTHPSNVAKEYLFPELVGEEATTTSELKKVFDQQPLYVVKAENLWYLEAHEEARAFLRERLAADYELVDRLRSGRRMIYRRSDGTTCGSNPD
jgi:hypothetical protein